jgi:hypothetical protein
VDRSQALTRKTTLALVDDEFDREVWSRTTVDQRFADTWSLSEEIWQLKGWHPGEPGLSRHTVRIVRR